MTFRFHQAGRQFATKLSQKFSNNRESLKEIAGICFLGGSIGLLIDKSEIVSIIDVHGQSMEPTLKSGQSVLLVKPFFNRYRPEKGDIIVCEDPEDPSEKIIKRIGLSEGTFIFLYPISKYGVKIIGKF